MTGVQTCVFRSNLVNAENEELVIRNSNPKIIISFAPSQTINWQDFSDLDPNKPDHQLIAEAILLSKNGKEATIVSQDIGPLLQAKRKGLLAFEVPDAWLLEPETDARDKEITRLNKEILKIKINEPRLSLSFLDTKDPINDNQPLSKIKIVVNRVQELEEEEIESIIDSYKKKNPRETFEFDEPGKASFRRNRSKIEKYSEEYDEYLEKLQNYFEKLPKNLEFSTRTQAISLHLKNEGRSPAKDLIFKVEAFGGITLSKKQFWKEMEFPIPPESPEIVSASSYHSSMGLASVLAATSALPVRDYRNLLPITHPTHDPNAFYFKENFKHSYTEQVVLTCDDFRHKSEKFFNYFIEAFPKNNPQKGTIKVSISASNLPDQICQILPVEIDYSDVAIKELAPPGVFPK